MTLLVWDDVVAIWAHAEEFGLQERAIGKIGRGRREKRNRQVAKYLADSRDLIFMQHQTARLTQSGKLRRNVLSGAALGAQELFKISLMNEGDAEIACPASSVNT